MNEPMSRPARAARRALALSASRILRLAGLLTLGSAAGCGGAADSSGPAPVAAVQGALADSPVRLLYGKAYNYGCSSCMTWGGVVEVENLAYDKEITVAYQGLGGGAAGEVRAGYLRTLPSGRELWSFSHVGANGTTQLRVRYRAAGRELWDRNGGWDYWARVDAVDGIGLVAVESPLGQGVDVAVTEANVTLPARGRPDTVLWTYLLVRNRAYHKQVRLISSTDGWATTKTADAAFQYGNGAGGEVWLGRQAVDVGATEISFAVSARMDGSESWDNNFGKNFTCRIEPDGVGWRCTGQALVSCSPAGCR